MPRVRFLYALCLLALGTIFAGGAHATEVIHNYHTQIEVLRSGDINVTELIEVTAHGNEIKRGIYRDLPLRRTTFLGGVTDLEYKIKSVKRDGQREPYRIENYSTSTRRIYIGNPSYFLPTGRRYQYEIAYSVAGQVFAPGEEAEIYWNAIGTQWSFPILNASVSVILPHDTPITNSYAYVGKNLSKGQDYTVNHDYNSAYFDITRSLKANEGVTVAVSFPKEYINLPPHLQGFSLFLHHNKGVILLLLSLLIMGGLYFYNWRIYGKDPKSRGLAPFYTPPEGISPAASAMILKMGSVSRQKHIVHVVLSIAAKGYLTISEIGPDQFQLDKTEQSERERQPLFEEEQKFYDRMSQTTSIGDRSTSPFVGEGRKLDVKLRAMCEGKYYNTNTKLWFMSALPLFAVCIYMMLTETVSPEFWMGAIFLLIFGCISSVGIFFSLKEIFFERSGFGGKVMAFFFFLWSVGFSVGAIMGLGFVLSSAPWTITALLVIGVGGFMMMLPIMKAPTLRGRDVMDHIKGFKYYLESVEEKILKTFDSPPQMSRELFEEYLPYAVALGVESAWADKYSHALGAAAIDGAVSASPSWYRGSGNGISSVSGGFSMSGFTSSLASSVSAASSSSSSSGGGSSGGGGGGGGGGGW